MNVSGLKSKNGMVSEDKRRKQERRDRISTQKIQIWDPAKWPRPRHFREVSVFLLEVWNGLRTYCNLSSKCLVSGCLSLLDHHYWNTETGSIGKEWAGTWETCTLPFDPVSPVCSKFTPHRSLQHTVWEGASQLLTYQNKHSLKSHLR